MCFAGDSPGGKTISVVKLKVSPAASRDQALAQVIVFSLLQKQKHPELEHHLIPNIVISIDEVKIFMYDSENDILVCSPSLPIFDEQMSLKTVSIVMLWLVLHYRKFSEGIQVDRFADDFNDIDFKSHFKEKAGTKWDVYARLLKENVSSFTVTNERDDDLTMFYFNTEEVKRKDD